MIINKIHIVFDLKIHYWKTFKNNLNLKKQKPLLISNKLTQKNWPGKDSLAFSSPNTLSPCASVSLYLVINPKNY